MERNYMLVYRYKLTDEIVHRYFETDDDMFRFIREELHSYSCEILHKYKIEEI